MNMSDFMYSSCFINPIILGRNLKSILLKPWTRLTFVRSYIKFLWIVQFCQIIIIIFFSSAKSFFTSSRACSLSMGWRSYTGEVLYCSLMIGMWQVKAVKQFHISYWIIIIVRIILIRRIRVQWWSVLQAACHSGKL